MEISNDKTWKVKRDEERAARHGNVGNTNAAFWTLPAIQRAEWALDVWASVKVARLAGIRETPTFDAIFAPPDEPDDNPLPFRQEGPGKVKVLTRVESKKRQLRKLEDGSEALVWLVRFTEQYIEKFKRTSSDQIMSQAACVAATVDGWLEDIGSPALLSAYLMSLYPRRGPYEAMHAGFSLDMVAGSLRVGRSAGLLEKGLGAMHRQALRDLGDWLADFGVRNAPEVKKPKRVRGPRPDGPYTVPTAREIADSERIQKLRTGEQKKQSA